MILSHEFMEFDDFFGNGLDVIHTEDGALPVRFTEKQLSVYCHNEALEARSLCPSGICLDFVTDSNFMCIFAKAIKAVRDFYLFDLFIDGCFKYSLDCRSIHGQHGKLYFELSKNDKTEHRVTLYLPHLIQMYISEIELQDDCIIRKAPDKELNILCLGDSITQGMNAHRPSSSYPVQLSRKLNANILNHGVGGYVFNKDSLDEKLPYEPDTITVAYGVNEWLSVDSIDLLHKNCHMFMERLIELYASSGIFVILPIWTAREKEIRALGTLDNVREEIYDVCSQIPHAKVINGLDLVPQSIDFFSDGVHPNDEGLMYYGKNLSSIIRTTIGNI